MDRHVSQECYSAARCLARNTPECGGFPEHAPRLAHRRLPEDTVDGEVQQTQDIGTEKLATC